MRTEADVRLIPVRDIGEVRMGKQLSPVGREAPGQFPYLRVANVYEGHIDFSDVKTMGFSTAEREVYGLRPGDILLNEGQELRLVGRSAIYREVPGAYCFQNTLIRFRPGPEVLPEYAQEVFVRWRTRGVFSGIAKRTSSIAHLGGERFGSLVFPLIPLLEQRRIVEVVDAVEAQERAIEASIAKLGSVRQGSLNAWFSSNGTTVVAKSWPMVPLENVAHIGSGITLNSANSSGKAMDVPYLRVANVQDGYISTREMKTVRVAPGEIERFRLKRGDVLLTEGGDLDKLGRGGVWDGHIDPCLHQNHIFRVRCLSGKVDPEFLALYFSSAAGRAYFLRVAKQTTNLASINSSQVAAMPVPCPPLSDQRMVVGEINALDEQVFREGSELAKLGIMKTGLLDDLLVNGT